MEIIILNTNSLRPDMLAYGLGHSHTPPCLVGVKPKSVKNMNRLRQTFLRNSLRIDPKKTYAFPEFNSLMAEEIWAYAKRELRPVLFHDWENLIRQTQLFFPIFNRESNRMHRAYEDAVDANRTFMKYEYLAINSKRQAFAIAVQNPRILGELELVCFGELRYGLP